ncbi:hypothetical protein OsI_28822 [Oryza sativa Indica Group]|nr:hypothetical protein OsI_28822 [Oryza sativa Indica Group]
MDQGAREHAGDEEGDTIAAVVGEDDAEESMSLNREGQDITPGLLDLRTTRVECVQRCCQYRVGDGRRPPSIYDNPGDAAARLEVNEEDPERLMMTSADNEVVNARTVMNTTKAAKLWSKGTTQLQLLCRCSSMNSTGGEAMLRRAPLSIPIANGGGPRAMALQPEGGMQRQPEA